MRGNRIVVAAVQDNYGVTIADISNPVALANPKLYNLQSNPPIRNAYGWTLNGNSLYAAAKLQGSLAGRAHRPRARSGNLGSSRPKKEVAGQCSTGGYVAAQDRHAFVGLSSCVHKFDARHEGHQTTSDDSWTKSRRRRHPPVPGRSASSAPTTTSPRRSATRCSSATTTTATPAAGSCAIAAAADTTRPGRQRPQPGRRCHRRAASSGVGLSFTDNLKPWTINTTNLPIRVKSTQAAVDGYYSYQLNIVNFRPAQPFAANTEYEVAVNSGVKDLAGNGAVASTATFKTAP